MQAPARATCRRGRLSGVRWVWTGTWQPDGTRLFTHTQSAREYTEQYLPEGRADVAEATEAAVADAPPVAVSGLVYTEGLSAPPLRHHELPFVPGHHSLWDVSADGVATHRPDGSRWRRLGDGGWRHEATGIVRAHPLPRDEATEAVRSLGDLSMCGTVLDLSIRLPKERSESARGAPSSSSSSVEEEEFVEIAAEAVRVRIECGAAAECAEMIRASLCTLETEAVDFARLRRCLTKAVPDSENYRTRLLGRITAAESEFQATLQQKSTEGAEGRAKEASIEAGVDHLLWVLRFLAVYDARKREKEEHAADGLESKHAATRKTAFRTHFLSLPYNPMSGLAPLWTAAQAREYLCRCAGFVAAYEAARNVAPGYSMAFDTWAEALLSSGALLRRHLQELRATSQRSAAAVSVDARNRGRDIKELLYFGSAGLNAFISWSSLRPGGFPIEAASPLILGVINGVWGTFQGFVTDLVNKARVQAGSGGWVWLAVNLAEVKSKSGDVRRHGHAQGGWRGAHAHAKESEGSNALVVASETSLILQSGMEKVRGRVVGYDVQVMTTPGQANPLTHGWYPLVGLELWEEGMAGRSVEDYVSAWLACVDWRLADFQLRTCYKERLQAKHTQWVVPYASVQPLGADRFHAVWLDILGPASRHATVAALQRSVGFNIAKKHFKKLTRQQKDEGADGTQVPPFVTSTPDPTARMFREYTAAVSRLSLEEEVGKGSGKQRQVRIAGRAVGGEQEGDVKKQTTLREAAQAAREGKETIEDIMMGTEVVEEGGEGDDEGAEEMGDDFFATYGIEDTEGKAAAAEAEAEAGVDLGLTTEDNDRLLSDDTGDEPAPQGSAIQSDTPKLPSQPPTPSPPAGGAPKIHPARAQRAAAKTTEASRASHSPPPPSEPQGKQASEMWRATPAPPRQAEGVLGPRSTDAIDLLQQMVEQEASSAPAEAPKALEDKAANRFTSPPPPTATEDADPPSQAPKAPPPPLTFGAVPGIRTAKPAAQKGFFPSGFGAPSPLGKKKEHSTFFGKQAGRVSAPPFAKSSAAPDAQPATPSTVSASHDKPASGGIRPPSSSKPTVLKDSGMPWAMTTSQPAPPPSPPGPTVQKNSGMPWAMTTSQPAPPPSPPGPTVQKNSGMPWAMTTSQPAPPPSPQGGPAASKEAMSSFEAPAPPAAAAQTQWPKAARNPQQNASMIAGASPSAALEFLLKAHEREDKFFNSLGQRPKAGPRGSPLPTPPPAKTGRLQSGR
eukprot:TRINITY_DN720_c0_g1_i2.p1 TRINITY_DN720_c0_g1~~TRINITY_DN720_c0_g1_i2.p1  ORF type:complete len:1243 (+),score=251.09 TRINITY_DN720_c0_g1_i2:114-3842(+)